MKKTLAQEVYERRIFNELDGTYPLDAAGNPNRQLDHATKLYVRFAHTIPSSNTNDENYWENTKVSQQENCE